MIDVAPAQATDCARFAAMERDDDAREFVRGESAQDHARRMLGPSFVYLRILHGGLLEGFIMLVLDADGTSVEFRRIVVAAKDRGIGQAAIRAMEAYCRGVLGRGRIWLDV